jgi:hypothetical protein
MAITVTDDDELALAVRITNNSGALGPPYSDVADVGNIHGFVASLMAPSSASANSSLMSEIAPVAAEASTSPLAAATAPPLVARATASASASLFLPLSSSTPRRIAPRQPAPPRRPISSTFVQPIEETMKLILMQVTLCVQLLKEEKLKQEIKEGKVGGKKTKTEGGLGEEEETFGGLGEEVDTFFSVKR